MCGIAGIINFSENGHNIAPLLNIMAKTISHRGPDSEGFFLLNNEVGQAFSGTDTNLPGANQSTIPYLPKLDINSISSDRSYFLGLTQRRLSIIDLSISGHQPMSYMDRYWIVYNGEVFNYIEIREELIKLGYTFISASDTEVIMAAYHEWGVNCLHKFNGMWAFALLDLKEQTLFIARDRFGIKPFNYFADGTSFVFASEIKALLKHPAINAQPNINYCKDFLNTGTKEYLAETAFQDIFRIPHGHFALLNIKEPVKGKLQTSAWWHIAAVDNNDTFFSELQLQKIADKYKELLSDAVRLRLRADVKLGAALSGGLDSSSIVSSINQILDWQDKKELLETFSTVYTDPNTRYCDESEFIEELANSLHVKSNLSEPPTNDVISQHEKLIYHLDTPPDNTLMSSWYTFKKVRECNVTITLDGQGADEQQGGYLKYLVNYFAYNSVPKDVRSLFYKIPKAKKYMITGIILRLIKFVVPLPIIRMVCRQLGLDTDYLLRPNERLINDTTHELVNLLHYADRTSMAFSVESRMPFMDYRMVQWASNVPFIYKLYGGWTKFFARHAMKEKLPEKIVWRKDKMGWPIPEDYWFKGPLKEHFCKTINNSTIVKMLSPNIDAYKEIEAGKSLKYLVRAYNLAVWHKTFFTESHK